MAAVEVARYEQVRHRNPEIIGASRGTVLTSFEDLEGRFYAVVLWKGDALGICETYWLEAIHR